MNNRVIGNLKTGKIGRSAYFSRKPVAYLNETGTWEFYFEDSFGAYAAALRNVDRTSSTIEVRVGERGQSPILTQSDGSFTNLTSTVGVSPSYDNHKLVFEFSRSPLDGYFTIGVSATATLAVATDYPTGAAVPAMATYSHTVLRDSTSGKIPYDASESEIEDHVRAMFNEMVAGKGGNYFALGSGSDGIPDGVSFDASSWAGYALSRGLVVPQVAASIIDDEKIGVQLYVPDFELQVPHFFFSVGPGSNGLPSGVIANGQWSNVTVPGKGSIEITSMTATSSGLVGPKGKTTDLDFSAAGFATLMGSDVEKDLWLEIDLDGETVCDGWILLKKKMS